MNKLHCDRVPGHADWPRTDVLVNYSWCVREGVYSHAHDHRPHNVYVVRASSVVRTMIVHVDDEQSNCCGVWISNVVLTLVYVAVQSVVGPDTGRTLW
jgi:hypothetical protein